MRDFLPRDKEHREGVLNQITAIYQRHGFESIETPALEDAATLHSGLGGDNEKLSFHVLKRGLTLPDLQEAAMPEELSDLGLRFDLTVPLARFYASNHGALPPVFRSFHTGPVWRAERPQKGRYRQFVQADIDTLGEASTLAEVEIVLATADVLDRLGVEGWRFRINDRRLLTELLGAAGIAESDHPVAMIVVDKLDKIGPAGVLEELDQRLPPGWSRSVIEGMVNAPSVAFDAGSIGTLMGDSSVSHSVAEELMAWVSQVAALLAPGVVVFDPTLVRGMGYYTSSIFEISHPDLGSSLGGGGRYDAMISTFLGREVPAVGMSLGFERLLDVVPESAHEHLDRVALVYEADSPGEHLLAIKMHLVSTGHQVRIVPGSRNMRAVYERLAADGFSRVGDVTSETINAGDITWRDID
jgi:histidyl-tRNA synthetase